MIPYPKIQSLYKRDARGRLMVGEYAMLEFEYLQDAKWDFYEKIDGTNVRVMIRGGKVEFGGRTDNAQMPPKLLKALQEHFTPSAGPLNEQFPDGACLYGEGYGAGIQKGGGNYRPDNGFVMFDIRVGDWWLTQDVVTEIGEKFAIKTAPLFDDGDLVLLSQIVSVCPDSAWGAFTMEGLIARPRVDLYNRRGERIITKLKAVDFKALNGE